MRPHVWRTDPLPGYAGTPPQVGEKSIRPPRLENRPPPRLRRYSPTSGGEIHTAPPSGEPTPSPATPVLPHKRGRNPYGPPVWRTDPLPGYAGTPPQAGEKSIRPPRLENRPPPRLRRYSPTSGGEIHTAPTSGEPTPSPATPVLPHKRGRNPYGPHVWRTDPLPGYAGTPPQVGEKSMRTSELDSAALLSRQIGGVDDTGDIGREIEARERLTVMCHRLHEVLDLGRVPADHLVGDEGLVPPQLGREHLGQLEVLDPLFVEEVGLQHVGGCQVCVEDRVVAVDLEEVARPVERRVRRHDQRLAPVGEGDGHRGEVLHVDRPGGDVTELVPGEAVGHAAGLGHD